MTYWYERAHEERNLLNPAFCSILLWYAGKGASENRISLRSSLFYAETFLVLPLVLHQETREALPSRITSSLPVWVNDNPLALLSLPGRARSLVPHTKEAIIFGGNGKLCRFTNDQLQIDLMRESSIKKVIANSSEEVQQCMKKSHFLGKWFTHTGTAETIFTILGVRP